MKLLFIYGPPASGKLTIAEKLSDITNTPLFHNHLTRDIVKDIYGDNLLKHYGLVDQLRLDVLSYCASHRTDLIFTYVYGGEFDDDNVHKFTKTIEDHGGEVVFIELTADREDLIKRVGDESRKRFKKLTDPEEMSNITEDMSIYSMPFVSSLKINTSIMTPDESVETIIKELKLI